MPSAWKAAIPEKAADTPRERQLRNARNAAAARRPGAESVQTLV